MIAVKPIRTFIVKVVNLIYLLFIYYINYNRYHIGIKVYKYTYIDRYIKQLIKKLITELIFSHENSNYIINTIRMYFSRLTAIIIQFLFLFKTSKICIDS